MKTENLIQALSRDGLVSHKLFNGVALAIAFIGFAFSCLVFFDRLHMRYNLWTTGFNPTVMKLVFTGALVVAAGFVLLRNVRPSDATLKSAHYLWVPVALFLTYVVFDVAYLGTDRMAARFYGLQHWVCFFSIILVAILPLFGLLWALQDTAPRHPGFAGMAAGLVCGGAAASVYALHCTNDSPLFLSWYVLAIAVTATLGALFAKRMLVW